MGHHDLNICRQASNLILAAFMLLVLSACVTTDDSREPPVAEDEDLMKISDLYSAEPADSPARFALNEIGARDAWRAFNLLRGDWSGSDAGRTEARETLEMLKQRIDTGLNWPYPVPPSFEIPHTATAPEIDGSLDDPAWLQSLSFQGGYPIDSVRKEDDGSVWKMMWDEQYLYVGVRFPDQKVIGSMRPGHPYDADSMEVFLMPVKRMKTYWEVIVGCDEMLYDGFHCNDRFGGWASNRSIEMKGLQFKTLKSKEGYGVEIAIPFMELPNYMLGNMPRKGQCLHFALVRTNSDVEGEKAQYSSPFPLLYGGHNIFGHASGVLK